MKLEDQAQAFAAKVMGMNRAERRQFARLNRTSPIAGSTIPFIGNGKTK